VFLLVVYEFSQADHCRINLLFTDSAIRLVEFLNLVFAFVDEPLADTLVLTELEQWLTALMEELSTRSTLYGFDLEQHPLTFANRRGSCLTMRPADYPPPLPRPRRHCVGINSW
jgi:hypothetical protein